MSDRKLKNLLIEPAFQLKFLAYFFVIFLLTIGSLYFVNASFFWTLEGKAVAVGIPKGHVFYKYIADQKKTLETFFFIFSSVNFLILLVVGFVVSHRAAGPYHKIKLYLRDLSSSSKDFKLRKRDFFKDIEPILNELKNRLK